MEEEESIYKTFEGKIEDIYFEYSPNKDNINNLRIRWWIKSTFRIRKKTSKNWETKYYYTIKTEIWDAEKKLLIKNKVLRNRNVDTRICKEKEFEIDYENFRDIITRFGLVEIKRKEKDRISYVFWEEEWEWIKFDFDKYPWKQDMLEVEASMQFDITPWLKKLWIDDKNKYPRMVSWSSNFLKNPETDEIY